MRLLTFTTVKTVWVVAAICLVGPSPAVRADLVLNIDASSDQFWLTGSDSGMMADSFPSFTNTMSWWYPPNLANSGYYFVDDLGMTFDSSPSTGFQDEALIAYSQGTVAILLDLNYDAGNTVFTFTGNETKLSYASFGESAKNQLEGTIGQQLEPVYAGRGWSNIPVVGVPEPGSARLLAAIGLIVANRRSRRGRVISAPP